MNCRSERQLGAELANAAGAAQTQAAIESKSFEDIFSVAADECLERGGVNALIDNVLQGPPRWSYAALRYLPDVGSRRDELLAVPRAELNTILSRRDYRVDALYTIALWARPGAPG